MGVSKVEYAGNTLIDLTNDNVSPDRVFEGDTFHGANGERKSGTFTLESEMAVQATVIDQIKMALQGKASGSGGSGGDDTLLQLLLGTLEEIDYDETITLNPYFIYNNAGIKRVRLKNATSIGDYNCRACNSLEVVDFPELTGQSGAYFCHQCSELVSVNIPKVTGLDNYAFQSASKLERLDLPAVQTIGNYCLRYTTALTTLILRYAGGVVTRGSSVLASSGIANKKGYVYVPAALIEDYKVASGWSSIAAQFRAIEDYPEICG